MNIKFACDCGASVTAPSSSAGKIGTCRKCGRKVRVPEAEAVPKPTAVESIVDAAPDEAPTPPPIRVATEVQATTPQFDVAWIMVASVVAIVTGYLSCVAATGPPLLFMFSKHLAFASAAPAVIVIAVGLRFRNRRASQIAALGLLLSLGGFVGSQRQQKEMAGIFSPMMDGLLAPEQSANLEPPAHDLKPPAHRNPAAEPANVATHPQAVKMGDVTISVKLVGVGYVLLKTFDDEVMSDKPALKIGLVIDNTSPTNKLDYKTYMGSNRFLGPDAMLTDSLGNQYRSIDYGFANKVVGRTDDGSIYPGKAIADVLIFEPPVPGATELILRLPGKNVGQSGVAKITIPASAIVWSD